MHSEIEQDFMTGGTAAEFMERELAGEPTIDGIDARVTRWIVYAGDEVTPDYKRIVEEMRMGGKVLGQAFKTLGPTKGFLRRCQLTPMIVGYDEVNADSVGDDRKNLIQRTSMGLAHDDPLYPDKRAVFQHLAYECLPGHELQSILQMQQADGDCGIREVEILRGVDPPKWDKNKKEWTKSKGRDLQYEIFPDWMEFVSGRKEFFKTSGQLAAYLVQRKPKVGADAGKVIDLLIDSNAAFERWATRQLDQMSRLVKAPITQGGRAYAFEPVHAEWFEMLELNREEFLMKKESGGGGGGQTNAPSREEFDEMRRMMGQLITATTALAGAVGGRAAGEEEKRGRGEEETGSEALQIPIDAVCAGFNAKGDPCGARPVKKVGEGFFCINHPKK